jgi:DNA-binding CsgD family transcriptional regulator
MAPVAIPASVLNVIADENIDPKRVGAEISTIVKSRRYAIFRLTRLNGIRASLVESSLDPEVSAYLCDLLATEDSRISKKLASSVVPFAWTPAKDPSAERGARQADPVWADFGNSVCQFFFRRNTPSETLVFVAQSPKDTDPLDAEAMMACQGWIQVVFDEVVSGARSRGESLVRVTMRERECLRWCAEGKTSEEIGIILSLSTHTVNHYLISATKKLNAVNRTHAITTAIRLGLLDINSPL